tara:strand:+ start:335 stop:1546 length:1212 start_codon:yes stop_codon:yes gene_type:complete
MIKTKITFNEELKRIQSLLVEQNKKEEPKNKCIIIVHEGIFDARGSDTEQAFTEFVSKVKSKLQVEFSEQQSKGNPVFITNIQIRGGASNHNGGRVSPYDVENDRKTLNSGKIDKKNKDYIANVGYATDRMDSFLNNLQEKQEELIIKIPPSVLSTVQKTKKAIVVNTGGVNDVNKTGWTAKDGKKYKPGQFVQIRMEVCQTPTTKTETKKEIKKEYEGSTYEEKITSCFEDAYIIIKYDGSGHYCNHAIYDIWANGHKLTRDTGEEYASLNNKGVKDDAVKIRAAKGSTGGRKNTFILKIDGHNSEFFNGGTPYKYKGDLVIEAACKRTNLKTGAWNKKGGMDCHKWVGTIDVYVKDPLGKWLPAEKVKVGAIDTPNKFDNRVVVSKHKACKNAVARTTTMG